MTKAVEKCFHIKQKILWTDFQKSDKIKAVYWKHCESMYSIRRRRGSPSVRGEDVPWDTGIPGTGEDGSGSLVF